MTDGKNDQMECPECGEDAVRQPTTNQVPWRAHELARPEWSHRDGSSLCPVIGPSGGYEPAQPQPRQAGADPDVAARPARTTERGRPSAGQLSPGPAAGSDIDRQPEAEE